MSPILMPNTSDMEDFRPSRPGTYRARIVKVEPKRSKVKEGGKGNQQMIEVFFKLEAPALDDGQERNISRRSNLMLEGAGTFGFDQILRATQNGPLADQIKANPGQVGFDPDVLIDKEVQVVLSNQMYQPAQGQARLSDQIDSYLPV